MRYRTSGLVLCLFLAACAGSRADPTAWSLLDGFEDDPLWAHDSADDHAELVCTGGEAVEGSTALIVRAVAGSRGKVLVRKEVDIDASALSGLRLAARTVAGPPPLLALALRAADGTWIESPRWSLSATWQRDLTWQPATDPQWLKAAAHVDRIAVIIVPQGGDCTVALDDLRAVGGWRWRSDPAVLGEVVPPPTRAGRFAPLELSFTVAWPSPARSALPAKPGRSERLLRRMVVGGAWITPPVGERWFQPAVCVGSEAQDGRALMRYAVRLAPDRAGTWTMSPGLDLGAGRWGWGPDAAIAVSDEPANDGPLQLDPVDRRWFMRADGSFVWPLGMNVAWAGDYVPWLDRLQRDGCNAVRVWLCPWNDPLDQAGDLQAVNQASAAAIDQLLDQALQRGIHVQLCLAYHGWFAADWARNPFNRVNGGPIAEARDFWTDAQARAAFRRMLDYVSSRWGHHPALMAWELLNEADLVPRYRDQDLIDWHREMAAYLARIDRHRSLITTSVAVPGRLAELWRLGDIDVVNIHRYEADPLRAIAMVAKDVGVAGKPGWAAEAGRDWRPAMALADPEGAYLRQALWWSWMHGLSASSWAWWWDIQVQNQDLTTYHAAIARYLAGEDPRGLVLRSVSATVDGLAVVALLAPDRGWAYAADPEATQPSAGVATVPARKVVLEGLAPGDWTVEVWDPIAGACTSTVSATVAEDGRLHLTVPAGQPELAWKLRRSLPLQPGVSLP